MILKLKLNGKMNKSDIEITGFTFLYNNDNNGIEKRDRISSISCCICVCYLKPEVTNGNSGRGEHGTHLHIKTKDGDKKGKIDILTCEITGNFNKNFENRIIKQFKMKSVKEEIILKWNKNRKDKQIYLDKNNNFKLSN